MTEVSFLKFNKCARARKHSLFHLLALPDVGLRKKSDPTLTLDGPLLRLSVRSTAVVHEPQDTALLARVDHLSLTQIHHVLVLVALTQSSLVKRANISGDG